MKEKKVKIGDKFKLKTPVKSDLEGTNYEVYHVTNSISYAPTSDTLVFLKISSRDGFSKGAKLTDCVPEEHIDMFYEEIKKS